MFKKKIEMLLKKAIKKSIDNQELSRIEVDKIVIETPPQKEFGDVSSPIAMQMSKKINMDPLKIAKIIMKNISLENEIVTKIDIAPPGFLNFWLHSKIQQESIKEIIEKGKNYGQINLGGGEKVQIEFVSANPVGPMHLGHGRWAAVGDTLARVFKVAGYQVEKEFYINDYGTQMDIFSKSVSARYCQEFKRDVSLPEKGYKGTYIIDIAREIIERDGDKYLDIDDREREVIFKEIAYQQVLEHIKNSLSKMRVEFDSWFSERQLHESGELDLTLKNLEQKDLVYEKDSAVWLKTKEFGDDKDRVLIRETGEPTYFFADIAYHHNKFQRGYQRIIDIWGADHHGYVKRMKAAIQALGYQVDSLVIIIGQFVNLLRGGEPVRMSKRTGEMVTLDELLSEVGVDAVRYFFTMRSTDTPLDFDIELAKEQSQNNPVFYVQYAHARINSILKYAKEKGLDIDKLDLVNLSLIKEESELALINKLMEFESLIEKVVEKRSPYLICSYLEDIATSFHFFYTKCRVVTDNKELSLARLALVKAVKTVLFNALKLLGVTAPESM